jgi:hypothetical protein
MPNGQMAVVFAAVRIAAWGAVLLFGLPRAVFPREPDKGRVGLVRGAARVAVSAVVIVQVLALVGMLNLPAIIGSFVLLRVGVRRYQRLHAAPKDANHVIGDGAQLFLYDVLDADREALEGRATGFARRTWHALLGILGRCGSALRNHVAVAVVCGGLIVVHLREAIEYPYPDTLREHAHLLRLKQLGAGSVLEGGYYPLGAHAFVEFLRGPTQLDPAMLWRLMVLACAIATVLTVYYLTRRFCSGDGCCRGGGVVAAALAAFGAASTLGGMAALDVEMNPMRFAAPVLLLLQIGLCSLQEQNDPWPPRWTLLPLGLLGFVHPIAWMVGSAGVLGSALCELALRGSSPRVLVRAAALVGLSAVGPLSLAVAAALSGQGLADGALAVASEVLYAPGSLNPLRIANAPLVLVGGGAAAWLLISKTSPTSCAGKRRPFVPAITALLSLAPLMMPHLGAAPLLSTESLYPLVIPLVSVSVGLVFDQWAGLVWNALRERISVLQHVRWAEVPGVLATGAVLFFAPPNVRDADAHLEPSEVVDVVYDIKAEFVPGEWTVVGHAELVTHTAGSSWTMTRAQFLERYTVEHYRWDPQQPQNTLPTPHVFFVVELERPQLRGQSATDREVRERENQALQGWLEDYGAEYGAPEVYYRSDAVVVYHVARTADEERKALQEAWEAAQRSQ